MFLDLWDCTVPDGPEQSLGLEPGFFIFPYTPAQFPPPNILRQIRYSLSFRPQ